MLPFCPRTWYFGESVSDKIYQDVKLRFFRSIRDDLETGQPGINATTLALSKQQ